MREVNIQRGRININTLSYSMLTNIGSICTQRMHLHLLISKLFGYFGKWLLRGDSKIRNPARIHRNNCTHGNPLFVILISRLNPKTGGEKYLHEVRKYIVKKMPVEVINFEETPAIFEKNLFISILFSNFWILYRLLKIRNRRIILFEDFHFHPRLILPNLVIKWVKVVRIISLVQLSLYYHSLLRFSFFCLIDKLLIKIFFAQCDKILCNSISTKTEVMSLDVNQHKIALVHCGWQLLPGALHYSRKYENKQKLNLLFVGRISSDKGIEYLIRAISLIKKNDLVLTIAGDVDHDPCHYRKLLKLIDELNIANKIHFKGHVSDPKKLALFYKNADVFVLPSVFEGFGIVLLEAMSFGLPIVTTKVGAIPELVQDGVQGVLIPSRDPVVLAEVLQKLINQTHLRERYGIAGLKTATELKEIYSWEAVGERIWKVLLPYAGEESEVKN